jgi:hypothetical protein
VKPRMSVTVLSTAALAGVAVPAGGPHRPFPSLTSNGRWYRCAGRHL